MSNDETTQKPKGKPSTRGIQSILGGYFLVREGTTKQLPFLLFIAFLAVIYIGNTYYAEKIIRQNEELQNELKELKFEYINTKSKLMQKSRQSEIAKSLAGRGIKESTVPPKKIYLK